MWHAPCLLVRQDGGCGIVLKHRIRACDQMITTATLSDDADDADKFVDIDNQMDGEGLEIVWEKEWYDIVSGTNGDAKL